MIMVPFSNILIKELGSTTTLKHFTTVAGGCVNRCYHLQTNKGDFFIKCNDAHFIEMFEMEYLGLQALHDKSTLSLPKLVAYGSDEKQSYLLMEYLERGAPNENYWELLGNGLAQLHSNTWEHYGWHTNNYIGHLPQKNRWLIDWHQFFWDQRLNPQMQQAITSNLLSSALVLKFEHLKKLLPELLSLRPPALLHGDLWSGNLMTDLNGNPGLVDPAVYYGHPEIELAFTTLFSGFDKRFYEAYQTVTPLAPGFEMRFQLYNLYPLLVHLNMFGTGYLKQISNTLDQFD